MYADSFRMHLVSEWPDSTFVPKMSVLREVLSEGRVVVGTVGLGEFSHLTDSV